MRSGRVRSAVAILGKALLGGGLVAVFYHWGLLNLGPLRSIAWTPGDVACLAAALGLVVMAVVLVAVRFARLLSQQGIRITGGLALGLTLIGASLGALLPGLIAGDVMKAAWLFREEGRRSRVLVAIVLDRVIALYALVLLGAIGAAIGPALAAQPSPPEFRAGMVSAGIAATLVLWLVLSLPGLSFGRALQARLTGRAREIAEGFQAAGERRGALLGTVLISTLSHLLVVVSYCLMDSLLTGGIDRPLQFMVHPMAMLMNMVSLTPGGIGITEGAFSYLYAAHGSPNGAAVGLLGRAIQYGVFFVGGAIAFSMSSSVLGAGPGRHAAQGRAASVLH
jgi:uncharacterized membrane protein YbhN (UPF0104 family)